MTILRDRIMHTLQLLALMLVFMMMHATNSSANTGGYPNTNATYCGNSSWCINGNDLSPRGYGYRNCTDYVAWKLQSLGVPDSKTRNLGHAFSWDDNAPSKGVNVNETPAVGSVAVRNSGEYGHVAFVEAVNGSTITISEYNHANDGNYGTRTVPASTFSAYAHYETLMTSAPGTTATPPPIVSGNIANGTKASLTGKLVTSSTGQDVAYITRRSDGGFAVAVWKQTPSGLQWSGVWWDQPGTSGVTYQNTVFFEGDADGDGLMDLYYATSSNWNNPGFSVALMHNTGSGFVYAGTQWNSSTLKLSQTKFIPGDWTGSGKDGFAYVTPRSDNGFAVAVFGATSSGLSWQGVWWDQPGTSGVQFANTQFMANDMDGNGISDLYYTTSQNWDQPGFSMALMHSNGSSFAWWGNQWSSSSIKLSEIRFLPGYWTGTNREGFAYVTKRSDNGFAVAVYDSTASGLQWSGVWWDQPGTSGVQFANTVFTPSDMDGDSKTDLYYTTSTDWSNPSFTTALQHSTGAGFSYWGAQWISNLPLNTTSFLPQG